MSDIDKDGLLDRDEFAVVSFVFFVVLRSIFFIIIFSQLCLHLLCLYNLI